jgi:bile acid:Na+ symporter, BASS family
MRPAERLMKSSHYLNRHLFWFLLVSYAVAAVFPSFGSWIRDASFGRIALFGTDTMVSLPMLMLSFLLLNAGLGVKADELNSLIRSPAIVLTGLAANLFIPIAFIFLVSQVLRPWRPPDEPDAVQNILVGLALIASMPIAGSSTAWSQNANGNLALSLGLVAFSTILSPLTTPLALYSVGLMARGEYSQHLRQLAVHGTGAFLTICVILPSILGMLIRSIMGEARLALAKPWLKLANAVNLLLLSYSNAALALPQTIAQPDPDFLAVTLSITTALCGLAFGAGWLIAKIWEVGPEKQASLMFGLGMNNNGTGLVLASLALANHPKVMIPIIFYNLVQQVFAGYVHLIMNKYLPYRGGLEGGGKRIVFRSN